MAYDQTERMNDEQKKEVEKDKGLNTPTPRQEVQPQMDTEFATDTWMGAVMSSDANRNKGNLEYDPYTYTERYKGEDSLDGGAPVPPLDSGRGKSPSVTSSTQQPQVDDGSDQNHYTHAVQQANSFYVANNSEKNSAGVEQVNRDYNTEAAAEAVVPIRAIGTRASDEATEDRPRDPIREPSENVVAGGGLGMVGLGLSLLSLFLYPYLLAPVGIVLGYLAYRREAKTMGMWAMIVGAAAILGAILIYPYFIAR